MRSRNPFDEIEQLFDRMSRQFEESSDLPVGAGAFKDMSVDVADQGDEFVVTADLPGFERENIDLTLTGDSLRISANRELEEETESEEEGGYFIQRERRQESVSRSVQLPEPVAEEETAASYQNGVLTVTLPKQESSEGSRHIEIS